MREFEKDYANCEGGSPKELIERKLDLIAKEVIDLGRIVELQAKDYVLEKHTKANKKVEKVEKEELNG